MNPIRPAHLGKRLLLTDGYTEVSRCEVVVLELSPSGNNVKLRHQSGAETWRENNEWECKIVEELESAP